MLSHFKSSIIPTQPLHRPVTFHENLCGNISVERKCRFHFSNFLAGCKQQYGHNTKFTFSLHFDSNNKCNTGVWEIQIHHRRARKIYSVQNSCYRLTVTNMGIVQRFEVMSDKWCNDLRLSLTNLTQNLKISEGS
jgi:hypothetical protein